jgi:3',5'-cyclic-AMP phosphodiesterase
MPRAMAGAGAALAVLAFAVASAWPEDSARFRFVLLGDRTGEAQAGVYERVWREVAAASPEFVVSVGDSIQGTDDATAAAEWREFRRILDPYARIPLYLAAGNHDVWGEPSARLFRQQAGHELHYGFDFRGAHFTVLDNSRSDAWPPGELEWLEADLRAHSGAAPKFVISHRPSWIADAALGDKTGPLHRLAKRYGVCCIVAGHVHQLIHASLDGVEYLALPSAGAHLRLDARYEDGWFFGWTEVEVRGGEAAFRVHKLEGPVTPLAAWGRAGLLAR